MANFHTHGLGRLKLPMELVIDVLSQCSPNSLTIVALACKQYGILAEQLLYQDITLKSSAEHQMRVCIQTLSSSPSKASYTRSFRLFLFRSESEIANKPLLKALSRALVSMTNLKILNLFLPWDLKVYALLNPPLRKAPFELTTLHVPMTLKVETWDISRMRLETIIIYNDHEPFWYPDAQTLVRYGEWLKRSPSATNLSFMSRQGGGYDCILSLPALVPNWSARTLQQCLTRDFIQPINITEFTLFIRTLCDVEELRRVVDSISVNFPLTERLELFVQDRKIHQSPAEVSSVLSLLPSLNCFCIRYWDGIVASDSLDEYTDRKPQLAALWSDASPALQWIGFPDRIMISKKAGTNVWILDT